MNKLYILSAPVQSGKTSALLQVIPSLASAAGFVCPDIDGLRKFINLSDLVIQNFQKESKTDTDDVEIGRFVFDATIFKQAQELLLGLSSSPAAWIIIDEIGKLELDGKGFEPALNVCLQELKHTSHCVLLVVRDYLLQSVIEKYNLKQAIVIPIEDLKQLI